MKNSCKENYIMVGYFTKDSPYEFLATEIARTASLYNIPCDFVGIDDQGSWLNNTGYKPTFLLDMFEKYKDTHTAIVYVDVDAEFMGYPEFFDELALIDCPIAVHNFDRSCYTRGKPNGFEVLSGTVYLQTCEKTKRMLEQWEQECINHPKVWDQKSLEKILESDFFPLPYQYCMIFDRYTDTKNPIIVHYQASRKYK